VTSRFDFTFVAIVFNRFSETRLGQNLNYQRRSVWRGAHEVKTATI